MAREIVDITYVCEACEEPFQNKSSAESHETSLPSPTKFEYKKGDRLWLVASAWPIWPVEVEVYGVHRSPRTHKNLYNVTIIEYGKNKELTKEIDKRRLEVNIELGAEDLTAKHPAASFFLGG